MAADTRDSTVFHMPSLGADMTEGRITEWLVQPGDAVERGQIVVIVETDKSDIEVEIFEPGTVVELLVPEGDLVPVGTPIARVDHGAGAPPPSPAEPAELDEAEPEPEPEAAAVAEPGVPPVQGGSHVTSPLIRHLADELHVDAEHLPGTGPGGRVQRDDVLAAVPPARPRVTPRAQRLLAERGLTTDAVADRPFVTGDDVLAMPETGTTAVATGTPPEAAPKRSRAETMRLRIASLMTTSWQEIPHFHVTMRLDLTAAIERLQATNEDRAIADRVVSGAVLLCAAARAAAAVPACNGWWREDRFEPAPEVRLGVVVSLRKGGIMVPTIERADEPTAAEMMVRLTELVQRARQGRLRASDMGEGTITVTNLGDLGADTVTGVIHPPQVAIVGFGAVHDEVWAVDGEPVVRPTVHASLGADHRALDGLTASKYLTQVQAQLDGPLLEDI